MRYKEKVDEGCYFKIRLDFTPSIGERWVLKYFDKSYLKFKGAEVEQTNLPGGVAYMTFTFKAKRATKDTTIVFDKIDINNVMSMTERFNIKIKGDKNHWHFNNYAFCVPYNMCCYQNPCYNVCQF